jgi:predicted HAD superfamily Cof-like phosphohydrolase
MIQAAIVGDLIGVIDALADSTYFSVGGFVTLAMDLEDFWDNVQAANMDKLGEDGKPVPHPTIPGKIGKREGWVPPEARHKAVLEELKAERLRQIEASRPKGPNGDADEVGD